MAKIEGFNGPEIDTATLPKSAPPTDEERKSMRMYIDSGCVTPGYLEHVAGKPGESVVLEGRSGSLCAQSQI